MTKVLITGANGQLGRRLITALTGEWAVEALVRSARARRMLLQHVTDLPWLNVTIADPGDAAAVAAVAAGCDQAVHLLGAIKETRDDRYSASHERPARALAEAATRTPIRHIVYLSILGADRTSPSRCLRARAAVEQTLLGAPVPATVIRVPMVLGESDRASRALSRRAAARRVFLFRAASLDQPIYAGDVISAIRNALRVAAPGNTVFDLAGPESLSRRELVTRAAAVLDRRPSIHSLPLALGMTVAGLLERFRANPPVTVDMLRVLDHDDAIDPSAAAAGLGITLTPLDQMLRGCVRPHPLQDTTP